MSRALEYATHHISKVQNMRMNSEQVELSVKVIRKYFADAAV